MVFIYFSIVVLYGLGALLPVIGLGRLAVRLRKQLREADALVAIRGTAAPMVADMSRTLGLEGDDVRAPIIQAQRALVWDVLFIGLGVIFGAAASIWSLFI